MSDPGRIAHYEILGRLGAGGMGEVYRARDQRLGRDVAIKVLPTTSLADPVARSRLLQEARAAAALNHPYICTVHEVGEADGQTYIAMELVDGQPLSERLAAGPLGTRDVIRYGLQLAEALAHAHQRGVVHRDFKSSNIIVRPDGRVKVLDFGLAKRLSTSDLTTTGGAESLTQPGTVMGTVAYMAPEQLRGEPAQPASDVWALGVVLQEMATGQRPFSGQTAFELSASILNASPAPLPATVPSSLRTVIGCSLEREPSRRYQDGGRVHTALETLAGESTPDAPDPAVAPTVAVPVPDPSSASRPRTKPRTETISITVSRRRAFGVVAASVVALVLGVVAWQFLPAPPVATLAILPFDNVQADEDAQYLAEGIADSLIDQLSGLPSVRVTPLSIALGLQGQTEDPVDVGRRFGVEAVLTGTLAVDGTQVHLAAALVDVSSGAETWAGTFDRDVSDLLIVQREIADAIIGEGLDLNLAADEQDRVGRSPTSDGEAYDLFLQARHLQRAGTENEYLEALVLLNRAIVRDPGFARAYLMAAGIHEALGIDGFMRPSDARAQGSTLLRRATELDPNLPDVHAVQHGFAFFYDWDWEGAARARIAAMQEQVGAFDPDQLRTYSLELLALGRTDDALAMARRSRELDPLSVGLSMLEADYLVHAGRIDEAIGVYTRTIEIEPGNFDAWFGLAEANVRLGRFEDAGQARSRAHELLGDSAVADLFAAARGEAGYYDADAVDVRRQIDLLDARSAWGYVSPLDLARAYAQLGDADETFRHLDDAFQHRSPGLVLLTFDPAFYRVRDDPRFEAALRRVGFPQYAG